MTVGDTITHMRQAQVTTISVLALAAALVTVLAYFTSIKDPEVLSAGTVIVTAVLEGLQRAIKYAVSQRQLKTIQKVIPVPVVAEPAAPVAPQPEPPQDHPTVVAG